MADPIDDGASPAPSTPRCPWCSAELPDPAAAICPSCKANLASGPEAQVPGLTALDLERLAFRRSTTPKKNRLLSWISGDSDYEDATDPIAAPGSLALPPADVRREMLRLERAALIAELTAEAGAIATDDALALGEADPAAAAAAIRSQLDVAARAQSADEPTEGLAAGPSPADDGLIGATPGDSDDGDTGPLTDDMGPVAPEGAAPIEASPRVDGPPQGETRRRFGR
ncbi:MAG: hypothetical protein ABI628_05910 [Chloroflexota bacterium]